MSTMTAISPKARAKLFATMNEAYQFDRDQRLDWASALLDRDIESFSDLSQADATVLIGQAEYDAHPPEEPDDSF